MSNESAVIALHEQTSDSLILTQRSIHLRDHPGEICFPGGRRQSDDLDLWATALRELEEELGVNAARVQLVRKLHLECTHNGSLIQPWLATILNIEPYHMNVREVTAVIKVPMTAASNVCNYTDIPVRRFGTTFITCQFSATNHVIWGATARIMKQLCLPG